jgi:NADH-quinone oxidoreductase subunit N
MFSLGGIPPLFGFWPKLVVFQAAIGEGLYLLAVAGFLASVVGAYYYIKIVKIMYFDAPGQKLGRPGNRLDGLLIATAALIVSPLGYLLIGPLGQLTHNAAESLF